MDEHIERALLAVEIAQLEQLKLDHELTRYLWGETSVDQLISEIKLFRQQLDMATIDNIDEMYALYDRWEDAR